MVYYYKQSQLKKKSDKTKLSLKFLIRNLNHNNNQRIIILIKNHN